MVAVTGSLAVNNVDAAADIDFLIVTEIGRLWLCRAMIIMLVKLAAKRGVWLCPNYFLSTRALHFDDRNLFSAHEIVQMVPISGRRVFRQLLEENQWVTDFLPNAYAALELLGEQALNPETRLQRIDHRLEGAELAEQVAAADLVVVVR